MLSLLEELAEEISCVVEPIFDLRRDLVVLFGDDQLLYSAHHGLLVGALQCRRGLSIEAGVCTPPRIGHAACSGKATGGDASWSREWCKRRGAVGRQASSQSATAGIGKIKPPLLCKTVLLCKQDLDSPQGALC